jgi:hypothetical protein
MSRHAPGYRGFVPAVVTATKAFDQGKGEKERNTILK